MGCSPPTPTPLRSGPHPTRNHPAGARPIPTAADDLLKTIRHYQDQARQAQTRFKATGDLPQFALQDLSKDLFPALTHFTETLRQSTQAAFNPTHHPRDPIPDGLDPDALLEALHNDLFPTNTPKPNETTQYQTTTPSFQGTLTREQHDRILEQFRKAQTRPQVHTTTSATDHPITTPTST